MLREIVKKLPSEDKKLLIDALDQEVSCFVKLGDKYVGVNLSPNVNFQEKERQGAWSYGLLSSCR